MGIAEEEDLVFADRTSEGASILVLMEGCALAREVVPRSEVGVAEDLEAVTVIAIRSCFGYHIDDAACEAAVFGINSAGQNTELCDRVEIRDYACLLANGLLHAG